MPARNCSKWSGRCAGAGASSSRCAARSASCSPACSRSSRSPTRSRRSSSRPPRSSAFRIVTALVFVAAGAWFFARPLSRKVTDEQVALYLEEHEPTLDSTILSAMEATERPGDWSPELIQPPGRKRDRARARDPGRRAHRARADEALRLDRRRASPLAAIALFTFGPAYFRHTLSAIFVISRDVEAAAPYRIEVKPGDATVAKGADQMISATLSGFDAAEAAILIRKGSASAFERVPMVKAENGSYEGMLFDLAEPLDYVIEAAGVRSAPHKLNVVEAAVREEDRSRIHLSVLHRPRAAQDRRRRRHRRAQGHRRQAHHHADDGVEGRAGGAGRKGKRAAGGECRRHAVGELHRARTTASIASSSTRPNGERLTASPQYTVDLLSRPRADGEAVEAGPRYRCDAGRGVLRRSARR